jgi:hypothetical protein
MKKLLYLLLAITFIGCSSDNNSSSNSSNNSIYTVKYEVTTDASLNSDGFWGEIVYTNSTGNDNEFSTNEPFWEYEMQIDPACCGYVKIAAELGDSNKATTNVKIYINGQLEEEATGQQGANARADYIFD